MRPPTPTVRDFERFDLRKMITTRRRWLITLKETKREEPSSFCKDLSEVELLKT